MDKIRTICYSPFVMNKLTWTQVWHDYRKGGFWLARQQWGKDAALTASEAMIQRNTPDSMVDRAVNRSRILAYSRAMGKITHT